MADEALLARVKRRLEDVWTATPKTEVSDVWGTLAEAAIRELRRQPEIIERALPVTNFLVVQKPPRADGFSRASPEGVEEESGVRHREGVLRRPEGWHQQSETELHVSFGHHDNRRTSETRFGSEPGDRLQVGQVKRHRRAQGGGRCPPLAPWQVLEDLRTRVHDYAFVGDRVWLDAPGMVGPPHFQDPYRQLDLAALSALIRLKEQDAISGVLRQAVVPQLPAPMTAM